MKANAAYDLSQFAASEPRQRVRVLKTGKELQAAADRKFLLQFVALTVAALGLAVYTVYSNMMLTKTKALITSSNSELVELQSENVYLGYQIESMVSLSNVQEYAETELDLIRLDTAQIRYVNLEGENRIVSQQPQGLRGTVASLFGAVMDWLSA